MGEEFLGDDAAFAGGESEGFNIDAGFLDALEGFFLYEGFEL